MPHPFRKHRKFWDGVWLFVAACFVLGAVSVHTLYSAFLLLLVAVTISAVPIYRLKRPGQPLPLGLKIVDWLARLAAVGFILWCVFWLVVILAFANSDWQW